MKKHMLGGITLAAAIAGLVPTLRAQTLDQSQFPVITQQPVDACVQMGSPVTFSVQATNVDSYQWYRNNAALDGQTNSSMTISSTSTNDVSYYSAAVIKGSESVPTRLACLNVYMTAAPTFTRSSKTSSLGTLSSGGMTSAFDMGGGGPIVVFGFPVVSGGGSGSCPGRYGGYVNFTKTVSDGWGWAPTANTTHTASDGNRSDTKIQFGGAYGDNGCAQTTVSIPNPTMSPVYRFGIYFPVGAQMPTNAYPITLTGFDP